MTDTIRISRDLGEVLEALLRCGGAAEKGASLNHRYIELKAALRSLPRDDGWMRVDEEHPLPDDLKPGDEVAVRLRYNIYDIEYGKCPPTAYRRATPEKEG